MATLKAIVSGKEKPIERYTTRVNVAEENKLFNLNKDGLQCQWMTGKMMSILSQRNWLYYW